MSWDVKLEFWECKYLELRLIQENDCSHYCNKSGKCIKNNCPIKLTDLWGN